MRYDLNKGILCNCTLAVNGQTSRRAFFSLRTVAEAAAQRVRGGIRTALGGPGDERAGGVERPDGIGMDNQDIRQRQCSVIIITFCNCNSRITRIRKRNLAAWTISSYANILT